MLKKKVYILPLITLLLTFVKTNAQVLCGLPKVSEDQKKTLLSLSNINKNARKINNYTIFVSPIIVHKSSGETNFLESQVFELINNANVIFAPINISFEILNNKIEHISDDKYYDFKTQDESDLRTKYDKSEAINIYFFHTLTLPDLSLLNGYTNLPNLSRSSNFMFFSYLENTPSEFKLLKERIFIHELGHYFGLLHTYQDSNDPDESKRELVTRGVGANCANTGDQLCDTNADPYERIPSIFSLGCSEIIPTYILDKNGSSFSPPVDNYMSYQTKCGNVFTTMQYQKMEAGLNIRLSSNAEYNIWKDGSNTLSIKSIEKKSFCIGEEVEVVYEKNGYFDPNNEVSVLLSDKSGMNFEKISDVTFINDNKLKFTLKQGLADGSNYRIVLSSSNPILSSPNSEHFEIKSRPSASITANNTTVNQGEEISLKINFGGTGPWSFKDWNGFYYTDIRYPVITINSTITESRLFTISDISNSCGNLTLTPSIYVSVIPPSLQISGNSERVFCISNPVFLEVKNIDAKQTATADYKVIINSQGQTYNLSPEILNSGFRFILPSNLQTDQKYALKISGNQEGNFSQTIYFKVGDKPEQPKIITPNSICFGATKNILEAEGKNLKWYTSQTGQSFYNQIKVNTLKEGNEVYYVSQTDSNGCESERSKMDVVIKPKVTAELYGSYYLVHGDSLKLGVNLTGESPWQFTISNLGTFTSYNSKPEIIVSPKVSTTYSITNVANQCGAGTTIGYAEVNVGLALANEPISTSDFSVFPNPVLDGRIQIDSKESIQKVELISTHGKLSFSTTFLINIPQPIIFPNHLKGKYILKVYTAKQTFQKHIILN
jgi:predicted Zn-dependent protease